MSEHTIEKKLLWLIALSLLLHVGGFALFLYLPDRQPVPSPEVPFIDLQNMPELKQQLRDEQTRPSERLSDRQQRVDRETAPRGTAVRDMQPRPESAPLPARQPQQKSAPASGRPTPPQPAEPQQVAPGSSVSSLLKPRSVPVPAGQTAQPRLFPSASRLARLEENYRRRFESDIAEGDTRFLNSDDIVFGSFLRRFENSVYGVWRYPQEAAMKGIEGVTPVRITFNRRGEITNVQLLESSGARVLDDEVMRTLRAIGPVGSFPRGYDKDEFHLIAFFQYGGARRSLR